MSRTILFSLLLAFTIWFKLCIAAPITITVGFPLIPGTYAISRSGQLLTSDMPQPNPPAVILPPTGNPGEQEWEIETSGLFGGTVTIKNIKNGLFLAPDSIGPNALVILSNKKTHWKLTPDRRPFHFFVEVPHNSDLVLDMSLLKIFPQRTALREKQPKCLQRPWFFRRLD